MNRRSCTRRLAALALGASWGLLGVSASAQADAADALLRAVQQDNAGAVRQLLTRGADPNTRNDKGNPVLYIALQEGALKAAQELLAAPGLQPEQRNASDESPLMMAALKGHLDMVRQLIALDAHVNKPGWAPLHYAATGGHLAIMELLLDKHAFIDAESPNGTTPLMMAAMYGTPEAVKLLIQSGADIHMRNQKGMTALDFAQQAERQNAVELLVTAHRYSQGRTRGQW